MRDRREVSDNAAIGQRLVRIVATLDMFDSLFSTGAWGHDWRCKKGVPEGAVRVGAYVDQGDLTLVCTYMHSSFDPVPPTGIVPYFNPEYQTIYDPSLKPQLVDAV